MRRGFILGFASCLLLVSCAGLFPYKYWGLFLVEYKNGKLLGPDTTGKDDLDISVCAPDAATQGKCVVMKAEEFFPMKSDLETTKQALIDCQKTCARP